MPTNADTRYFPHINIRFDSPPGYCQSVYSKCIGLLARNVDLIFSSKKDFLLTGVGVYINTQGYDSLPREPALGGWEVTSGKIFPLVSLLTHRVQIAYWHDLGLGNTTFYSDTRSE